MPTYSTGAIELRGQPVGAGVEAGVLVHEGGPVGPVFGAGGLVGEQAERAALGRGAAPGSAAWRSMGTASAPRRVRRRRMKLSKNRLFSGLYTPAARPGNASAAPVRIHSQLPTCEPSESTSRFSAKVVGHHLRVGEAHPLLQFASDKWRPASESRPSPAQNAGKKPCRCARFRPALFSGNELRRFSVTTRQR